MGVGFVTGVLSGALGVGGGFIRMPLLVYVLGVPTHVAVGTDLFEIVFSSGYGTITHALKGNVDFLMALVMQTGRRDGRSNRGHIHPLFRWTAHTVILFDFAGNWSDNGCVHTAGIYIPLVFEEKSS